MRNAFIIFSFLFLHSTLLLGQGIFSGGISLYGEYSSSQFETKGINTFVNSFNNFWGEQLSTPLTEFKGNEFSHPNIGIGFRVISRGKMGFSGSTAFMYGKTKYSTTNQWSTQVENEMLFKVRDLQWTVNAGLHFGNLFYLEAYSGAHIRRLFMEYATVYPDGSRSLSSEYKLNGLYSGNVSTFDVGVQAGFRIKFVMLYARLTKPLSNFPTGKGLISLDDYDNVNYPPSEFPTDYEIYATDPIQFVEEDLGLKTDDFEGMRLSIGIELIFGAKNKKS